MDQWRFDGKYSFWVNLILLLEFGDFNILLKRADCVEFDFSHFIGIPCLVNELFECLICLICGEDILNIRILWLLAECFEMQLFILLFEAAYNYFPKATILIH